MTKHKQEEIIQKLKELAIKLGKRHLSQDDVARVIPFSSLRYHFGTLNKALEAAGLDALTVTESNRKRGVRFSDSDLFSSIWQVEQKLGHEPSNAEYHQNGGQYTDRPFRKRFGKWDRVLGLYREWKAKNQPGVPTSCKADLPPLNERYRSTEPPSKLYGAPINFRGLTHAPLNEQGVVFLFGIVCHELGFFVESLQQGFPDCEAKFCHDAKNKLWARARIEFEYKASSFLQHGHDSARCDFIVCWENDWPDCPIKVIELRSEIEKLPADLSRSSRN